ncbi:MAG: selenocysteine-specific translation elongation factor [Gammaproteobacteria bacterium]|nr:selenocysteine-specific translation elongation factor [Gammaproteobacteria bacterium]
MTSEASPTRTLTIATAGHVDHGKTALVRNLTGIDTDTLAEEKSRGLSINLGFAYKRYEADGRDCLLGFADVPGHIDFIGNMLAGVGAVDAAVLVVAADDGVMPQTEEHAAILDLLDVRAGCVVLSKTDRASKTRRDKVKSQVRQLLAGGGLAEAPVFPVDNLSGAGIERLGDYLHRLLLGKHRREADAGGGRFRFLIDRSFSVRGIGTVVTGSCRAGSVELGQSLLHSGGGGETRLRGIRVHQQDRKHLSAGERAALNITLDHSLASRGDWLLDGKLHHPVSRFDARLRLLPGVAEPRPNTRHHLHLGASHQLATLRRLGSDGKNGDFFQVKTREPVHALHGDRFILRDPAASRTLGGGTVVDIFVPARGRETAQRLARLSAMEQPAEAACRALTELLPQGIDLDEFSLCRNLGPQTTAAIADKLRRAPANCVALRLDGAEHPRLLGAEPYQLQRDNLLAAVAEYHRANPQRPGVGASQLPAMTGAKASPALLKALIERLIEEGGLRRSGSLLRLPGHSTRLGGRVEQLLGKLRPILQAAGKIPPRTRELAEMTGVPLAELEQVLRQAEISKQLARVAPNRHYLPETIDELATLVEKMADGGKRGFSVIEFRDASGIGRNLCIEILEYFDHTGLTRRDGNLRFLRPGRK